MDLMNKIKNYKKHSFEQLSQKEIVFKPYLNELKLNDARTRFKLRARMLNTVKFNFQSDPQFTSENWKCTCNGDNSPIQSQQHLEICPKYGDLRQLYDLETDQGIVEYFDAILQRCEDEDDADHV